MSQRRRQVDSHLPAKSSDDTKLLAEAKRNRSTTKKKPSNRYLKYFLFLTVIASVYLVANNLLIPIFFSEETNKPLDLPKLVGQSQNAPERFWGTYRSNLYFGLKHRSPQSLSAGFMWFDYRTLQKTPDRFIRHWCDQNDRLKYGWTYHDGERFGIEDIEDEFIKLRIEWLKQVTGQHGGDWTARIHLQPRAFGSSSPPPPSAPVSLFFYFHYDQPWIKQIKTSTKQSTDRVFIRGQTNELDGFSIKVKTANPSSNQLIIRTMTDRFSLDTIHQKILQKLTQNPPRQPLIFLLDQPFEDTLHNTIFIQLTLKTVPSADESFSFDILFQSDSSNDERIDDLSGPYINEQLIRLQKQFDQRFEEIFQLKTKQKLDDKRIDFARSTLSHLIGGIAYFTGQSLVAKPNQKVPDLYWTTNLYTAVPSRSFFPRGFLWDEGFHNLIIARWNRNLTRDILSHWLDMLNSNGWIPREIILGDEARARVPSEFVIQYTSNANPPTFFLTIDYLLKIDPSDPLFTLPFIQRLEKWYQWYNRTQVGPVPFSFRWRGRNASSIYELNPKTLTSGLDDYPRSSHPTDSERHLDLRCWMTLASNVLGKLYAKIKGESTNTYLQYAQLLSENDRLDQLHWSEKDEIYADFGLHTDDVQLQRVFKTKPMQGAPPPPTHMIRQMKDDAQLEMKFVKHFGYVSLFPLMTRLLNPQSEKLGKIFNDLKKANLLWTPYGLRSLAQSSPLYAARNTEHDPPYWRGAIWINMNYMVLSALQHYAKVSGPYADQARQIYRELRENILKNMFRVYQKTGHIWEQYDDKTGEGKGCHPFNGWSSLIVLIMSELYDE